MLSLEQKAIIHPMSVQMLRHADGHHALGIQVYSEEDLAKMRRFFPGHAVLAVTDVGELVLARQEGASVFVMPLDLTSEGKARLLGYIERGEIPRELLVYGPGVHSVPLFLGEFDELRIKLGALSAN